MVELKTPRFQKESNNVGQRTSYCIFLHSESFLGKMGGKWTPPSTMCIPRAYPRLIFIHVWQHSFTSAGGRVAVEFFLSVHHQTDLSIRCSFSKCPSHVSWWGKSSWVNIKQLRVLAISIQYNSYKSPNFNHIHGINAFCSPHDDVSIQIWRWKDLQICFLFESLQNRRKWRKAG